MASRRWVVRGSAAFGAVVITLVLLVAASYSADETVTAELLINNSTEGYYNDSIGNKLDGLLPWFPTAPASPDPTLKPIAPEPDPEQLVTLAGLVALFEVDPLPLGSGWGGMQLIPRGWTQTTETAIIYEIDAGDFGIKDLTGNFGVDNGIYVWVDGRYKFGAMAPGGAPLGEYPDVKLDDLGPGKHYLQILREDHGAATGYAIEVTGTFLTGPAISMQVESPKVTYDGREQPPGQVFHPEPCPPGSEGSATPCAPVIELSTPVGSPELSAGGTVICSDEAIRGYIILILNEYKFAGFLDKTVITQILLRAREFKSRCMAQGKSVSEEPNLISLELLQGGVLAALVDPHTRWQVTTPVAELALETPGTAGIVYDPDSDAAGISAFNAVAQVTVLGGSPFTIGPAQQVIIMGGSIGTVADLPQVFLPAISR